MSIYYDKCHKIQSNVYYISETVKTKLIARSHCLIIKIYFTYVYVPHSKIYIT